MVNAHMSHCFSPILKGRNTARDIDVSPINIGDAFECSVRIFVFKYHPYIFLWNITELLLGIPVQIAYELMRP